MLRRPDNGQWTTPRVVYLSSYPPRKCGLATFTYDLLTAVEQASGMPATVVAMNDNGGYEYDHRVIYQMNRDHRPDYTRAAAFLNRSPVDLVNVQHEYGLFGGDWGEYLVDFYRALEKPVVTTLHTVLPNPDPVLKRVTDEILAHSHRVVVLTRSSVDILRQHYTVSPSKLSVIPHGVPVVERSPERRERLKTEMGYAGRCVLSTFGLINPNKGIEYVLHALADVVPDHPEVLYLVVGQTHPGVQRHSGEQYREMLQRLVRELGLEAHVVFVNKYLTKPELVRYLELTDIYLMPYLDPNQIVSGTLAYALGAGKAVIATPSAYAQEVLADGRGILVPFRDSQAIARAITFLLDHPEERAKLEERAYASTRHWTWPAVGRQYLLLFQEVTHELATREARPLVASYGQLRHYPARPVYHAPSGVRLHHGR